MIEKLLLGLFGCAVGSIYYLLRKAGASKEMANLIEQALKEMLIEKAINAVEAWAEKKLKATGEKIAGSEKMKKAIEEVKNIQEELAKWGIKVNIGVDDKAIQDKIQAVFDRIKEKLHKV